MFFHDALANGVVRYLTAEQPGHARRVPVDMDRFKAALRPGDVVLVEGRARISRVIMTLTQSSWSHAFLYLGDALLRWGGPEAERAVARFGPEAAFLAIESDMREGVRVVPVVWYGAQNLRLCRPHGLKPEDRDRVLAEALRHLGVRYDRRNIFDLGRYLTPFHLLPAKWRRKPLYLGSSTSREIICSALLAKAFYKVNYPIAPQRIAGEGPRRWAARHPSYIMPRDFDLSPNFEILKVDGAERQFGYGEA
jgi:hypothetical protein